MTAPEASTRRRPPPAALLLSAVAVVGSHYSGCTASALAFQKHQAAHRAFSVSSSSSAGNPTGCPPSVGHCRSGRSVAAGLGLLAGHGRSGPTRVVGLFASSSDGGGGEGGGSNFYNDFEDFASNDDGGDDDDDDDEAMELDEKAFAKFRSQMDGMLDEDDDEDEEGDEDEDAEFESEGVGSTSAAAGTMLSSESSVDDLISFARKSSSSSSGDSEEPTEWAKPLTFDDNDDMSALKGGVVLIANPSKFCSDLQDDDAGGDSGQGSGGLGGLGNPFDFGIGGIGGGGSKGGRGGPSSNEPSPALLSKFGLTLPPPADLGPDRRADLLPVLVLLERHPLRGCQAVLMNRRTGYLLGDLESQAAQQDGMGGDGGGAGGGGGIDPPKLGAFMIQPLWFGGTSAGGTGSGGAASEGGDAPSPGGQGGGLDMLHLCAAVDGARRLTEDGLYWGGDPAEAQEAMSDPSLEVGSRPLSGFDFKFFVQSTRWLPMQLEKEIRDGTWFVASTSKEVLFKSRDRLGSKRAKPLWTEVMELMGEDYRSVRDRLYGDAV